MSDDTLAFLVPPNVDIGDVMQDGKLTELGAQMANEQQCAPRETGYDSVEMARIIDKHLPPGREP